MHGEFITAWNTGRGYSEDGQRIAIWLITWNGGPWFPTFLVMRDYDRGLTYAFVAPDDTRHGVTKRELRAYVQRCYDFNERYLYGPHAREAEQYVDQIPIEQIEPHMERWAPIYP